MPTFTVQDSRLFNGPRVPIDEAGVPLPPVHKPILQSRLQHDAASTGVPGWLPCPLPYALSSPMYEALLRENSELQQASRRDAETRSWTCRTGRLPHRASFGDKVVSVMLLLNAAFNFQHACFARHQAQSRVEGQRVGLEMIPHDVMEFQFRLPWIELRDEVVEALQHHYAALRDQSSHPVGSNKYAAAAAAMQRTSPESIVLGLSAMVIFDVTKWSALDSPFDEAEEGEEPFRIPDRDDEEVGDDAPSVDNGSFMPTPGYSPRAVSPAHDTTKQDKCFPSPPNRPGSLADCFDPAEILARQQASMQFRAEVLRLAVATA